MKEARARAIGAFRKNQFAVRLHGANHRPGNNDVRGPARSAEPSCLEESPGKFHPIACTRLPGRDVDAQAVGHAGGERGLHVLAAVYLRPEMKPVTDQSPLRVRLLDGAPSRLRAMPEEPYLPRTPRRLSCEGPLAASGRTAGGIGIQMPEHSACRAAAPVVHFAPIQHPTSPVRWLIGLHMPI